MYRIGIINKCSDPDAAAATCRLANWLQQRGCWPTITTDAAQLCQFQCTDILVLPQGELVDGQDLIVVIGGDGTFIAAARAVGDRAVPLLGINMGRLGFLTEVPVHAMYDTMAQILTGVYVVEERMLLSVVVQRGRAEVLQTYVLNDVVVHKGALGRMIECAVAIDGQSVFSSRADGLIVATPTGSTGYALSSGGPIVHPSIDVILLVPVCPHTLTSRPIVVPGHVDVLVTLNNNSMERLITLDGQQGFALAEGDEIHICRALHRLQVLHVPTRNYYDVLRSRLRWGEGVGVAGNG